MNRIRKVIIVFLLAGLSFALYKGVGDYGILPQQIGVLVVNDSGSPESAEYHESEVADSEAGSSEIQTDSDDTQSTANSLADTTEDSIDTGTPEGEVTQENLVEVIGQEDLQMFYYEEISQEIKDRIMGKSYGENCDVPFEELRYVKVLYYGFDGETHSGELIVNKAIAQDIVDIFKELYEQQYPIEHMVLVDEYDADDNTSMAADNTSAFNYRVIDGTNRISLHSYGLAIDINPLYNPYVREMDGKTIVTPVTGTQYADRTLDCEYYIKKDDICYQAFISRGFTWGGEWKTQKDYQHFQKKID